MDQEELARRRQARQEARAQRKKQQRKTILKLAAVVAMVIFCTVLIVTLSRPEQGAAPSPEQTQVSADPTAETTENNGQTTVIHLAAAGDLNITQALVESGGAEYDYTATFMDVVPLLAQADITLMNLEGSFYGAPYGVDRSAPQAVATALSGAGVDLLQIANSYTIYKGMDGLRSTVEAVRTAGIEPVGAYATNDEAKAAKGFTLREVNGVRIAFVAFTKGMDGMALPPGNEKCVNVLYKDYASDYQQVDTEGITALLENVAKAKPDITVALLHWGSEYNNTISKTQEEICKLLQENGVDAIIGTHSHYVQRMTLDPETGNFVAYSLGDFCSNEVRAGSEYSVVLDLEITKDNKTGKTKITNFSYTPIFTVLEPDVPLRIVRIDSAIAAYEGDYIDRVTQTTYDAMKYALERIEARIHEE